jgi:tetratricopeptide (TPR) repeat protein
MAIKGSLKEASLADVCQLLALGQKSGCLSVTDRSRFGQIYFERGRITYAHIVNRRERLGDLMVRDGVLAADQLAAVLSRQSKEPSRRVGELLVDAGSITTDTLAKYVRLQIEEAIYHLFTWTRGSFFFEPDEKPPAADILVSINPESLLLEAARRVDEWSQFEQKITSFDLIFEVDRRRLRATGVELTAEQEMILPLLDGERALADIVDASGLTEFDVGKAVYGLLQAGFAQAVGRRDAMDALRTKEGEITERRNLGTAFFRTHMYDEAAREFERVLELSPDDVVSRFHLGLIMVHEARYRDAVRQFKTLLEQGGPRHGAFVNMAYALRRLGRHNDALLVLQEAERLRPSSAPVALARAVTHLELRDIDAAIRCFEQYRERLGENRTPAPLYFHYAALANAVARNLDGARAIVREGLERYPDSAPLIMMEGLILERKGDIDGADRCYRRVIDEDGSSAQAQKNLGDVAYRRGSLGDALQYFTRAAQIDPRIGDDTYAKLGNLHYKARDIDAAIQYWKRALELNPENQVVRNNLQIAANAAD